MRTLNDQPTIDISLVILTFNRREALRRCLDSISAMNKGELSVEVIVVDDGSEIDNLPVISQFKETLGIRYFKKNNQGVASTRNFGIRKARGKFIGFIADDYTLPGSYLSDVAEFYNNHPEAWVITHNIRPTGPSVFRYVQRLYYQMTLLQRFDSRDLKQNVVKSSDLPPSRGAVFRKEIFDILGYFNEDFLTGEDGEFGMRMASRGIPVYFFPKKFIEHFEEKDLRGYLDQRIRYGSSFYRAVLARDGERTRKPSIFGTFKSTLERYYSWLKLSHAIDRGAEYLLLSPFIILFLIFYYAGFYSESRKIVPSYKPARSRINS
ncbi:MAG: glycosyltransferase [Thermodesulfobacteriota bacterium]